MFYIEAFASEKYVFKGNYFSTDEVSWCWRWSAAVSAGNHFVMQSNNGCNAIKQILKRQLNIYWNAMKTKHWNATKKYWNAINQLLECNQTNIRMQRNKYENASKQISECNSTNIGMQLNKYWNTIKQILECNQTYIWMQRYNYLNSILEVLEWNDTNFEMEWNVNVANNRQSTSST